MYSSSPCFLLSFWGRTGKNGTRSLDKICWYDQSMNDLIIEYWLNVFSIYIVIQSVLPYPSLSLSALDFPFLYFPVYTMMHIHCYIYIHTYIHTYIQHTYIYTYIPHIPYHTIPYHTYITYIHTIYIYCLIFQCWFIALTVYWTTCVP